MAELRPIIMIKESNTGLGMQLRLAAGPLKDAAAAAKICAVLSESQRGCETTVFDGQRLAMRADEAQGLQAIKPESAAKPNSVPTSYKRGVPKHIKQEDQPPPKPEPSTFSSLFGLKH